MEVHQALCPRCGDTWRAKVRWRGRGVPRIYCHGCRSVVNEYAEVHEGPKIKDVRISLDTSF
jgi:transposase-like protein